MFANANFERQILAVIMAGGIGERFWPLSTPEKPKQLLPFGEGGKTLIEDAVDRIRQISRNENIWIATSETLKPVLKKLHLCPESQILGEPSRRNTAGALSFTVAHILAKYENKANDLVMAVLTADHKIQPVEKFIEAVIKITEFVSKEPFLGVMGIVPTRPETGYGYIESGEEIREGIRKVNKFHEKPNIQKAKEYIERGNYFWNSGMFFWKIKTFLNELKSASPIHYESIFKLKEAISKNDHEKIQDIFNSLPDISIDYALMEHTPNIVMVKAEFFWDDLGSWTSLERIFTPDENGNIIQGNCITEETSHCIIYNQNNDNITIATLGIENIVIAVAENTVLVMHKNKAQKIKTLLAKRKDI